MRGFGNLVWVLAASLLLTGCFEDAKPADDAGGSATAPAPGSPPPGSGTPTNKPPIISLASQSVLVGRELRVRPTASDPDGQKLTFSIQNQPAWLKLDSRTGEIAGTPTEADVGMHEKIRLTVSDGQAQASVTFSVTVTAVANGRASLSWEAPSQRADGTPLTDLAGFRIYYGTEPGNLRQVVEVKDPGARSWVVEDLTSGTWYFAATAFDAAGLESVRSNPASKKIG